MGTIQPQLVLQPKLVPAFVFDAGETDLLRVLQHVSIKDAHHELGISKKKVDALIDHLFEKTGTANRTALVVAYIASLSQARDAPVATSRQFVQLLSPGEVPVVQRLIDGAKNQTIAAELNSSEQMVKNKIRNVFKKAELYFGEKPASRTHLAALLTAERGALAPRAVEREPSALDVWRAAAASFVRTTLHNRRHATNLGEFLLTSRLMPGAVCSDERLKKQATWVKLQAGDPSLEPRLYKAAVLEMCRVYRIMPYGENAAALKPSAERARALLGLSTPEAS